MEVTPPAAPPGGGKARRARILDAASRVFAREGFAGASIDVIAAEAGVSRQTVYNQFGDKEKVFAAVVEDTTERASAGLFATLASFPDRPKDLEAELVGFARRLAATCMCDRRAAALYKLVETEGHRYPELFEAWRERGPGRVWAAVSARLSRLAHDGLLDLDDPDLAARQLISLVNMDLRGPAMMGQRPSEAEVDAATRAAVRTFLRAYGRERNAAGSPPPARR
ncbi:MAG TPA: TetR/AcrR family transcriptional regulator [Bauldia sp.]|nr:TetR/AcrR family transcriptional regulator [Bauldia sp.]